jgi:succinoglycan biosynthesis transport protein ExoP
MQRTRHDALQLPPFGADSPSLGTTTAPPPGPPHAPHGDGVLETAWRILRRQWFIVLQAVLVTAALAVVFSSTRDKQYTASASLLFGTPSETVLGTGSFVDENRQAATNEALLKLGVVAQSAAALLNGRATPLQIEDAISVVSQPEANLIDVEATTDNRRLSADMANAYSNAFIEFRQRSDRDQIEEAIGLAEQGRAALTDTQRAGPEGEALDQRIQELETAKSLQTGGAELVQTASPPAEPSAPHPVRDGILGAMLGLVFGFGLAAVRERWNRSIKSVDELEAATGWPVLSRVPRSRTLARRGKLAPRSAEAEAFRMLRASLRYFSINTKLRSLLVTSALPGEGKSTTARRLAETMAAMGDRVVLVEADMHRGAGQFSEERPSGLSGALTRLELDEVLLEVPVAGSDEDGARALTILPSGPLPPNPSELLESERMRRIMDDLHAEFDMVIIDSPPLPLLSDAMTLVGQVSGVIVVTAVGKVTHDQITEFANQLWRLRGNVLGTVANFAPGPDRVKGYYGERK